MILGADVGISVFDENVPDDYDQRIEEMIMPEVRRAESQYIPYFAKNLLQSTGNWGAVRVVPRPTHAVDVIVSGKILRSNGESMALEVTVQDAIDSIELIEAEEQSIESGVPIDLKP